MHDVLQELVEKGILWRDELVRPVVERYCEREGMTLGDGYGAILIETANRFLAGKMTFHDADLIANVVDSLMWRDAVRHGAGFELPEPAWSLYCAFDAGEWDPDGSMDPVNDRTIPMLKEILGRA